MHHFQTVIGVVAAAIEFVFYFPYIVSILLGKSKPSRATFGIWATVDIIGVASYIASGARSTIWIGLVYALFNSIVFGLSLKYGLGGLNRIDGACILAAAVSLILWLITRNPQTALYLTSAINVTGFLPTIRKIYYHPETENALAWSMGALAALLNLAALTSLQPKFAVFPFSVAIPAVITASLIVFPRLRLRSAKT